MKKVYFAILLLAVVFIAGCKSGATGKAVKETGKVVDDTAGTNTIEITSSGFSPNALTIKQGDTVTWVNKDTNGHWPASAMHPTREKYPGSSITKCGTAEESKIFDACKNIDEGSSWSFTFNEKGTWTYNDHSNLKLFGKVIVE